MNKYKTFSQLKENDEIYVFDKELGHCETDKVSFIAREPLSKHLLEFEELKDIECEMCYKIYTKERIIAVRECDAECEKTALTYLDENHEIISRHLVYWDKEKLVNDITILKNKYRDKLCALDSTIYNLVNIEN